MNPLAFPLHLEVAPQLLRIAAGGTPMPIAKITGQGLAAMAVSVGLLWGSVIFGQIAQRNAFFERARVIREVRELQQRQRSVPVSTPSVFAPRPPRVTAG
jgi:hypothetical protein